MNTTTEPTTHADRYQARVALARTLTDIPNADSRALEIVLALIDAYYTGMQDGTDALSTARAAAARGAA